MVATRQIGDVLLTTPLIRALHLAYPHAQIDLIVYEGKQHILEGNSDIHQIITVPERPTFSQSRQLIKRIAKRYDLAISTLSGDRPLFYTWMAARQRVSIVPPARWQDSWKRWISHRWVELDDVDTHTVLQLLQIADALEIPRIYQVIPPFNSQAAAHLSRLLPFAWHTEPYAVFHPTPMWHYKRWRSQGWIEAAHALGQRGWRVVLTGSNHPEEQAYLQELMRQMPCYTVNMAGQLNFPEVTALIQRAKIFIGVDTSVTHLAAATGTPTVALFGPTNPVKWAPFPKNYQQNQNPFQRIGNQIVGNVALVQGTDKNPTNPCVPCHQEGCDHHRRSQSECLQTLPTATVTKMMEQLLLKI